MKENIIREYLSSINFKKPEWSLKDIKADLKTILGEDPGIKINWSKDVAINEVMGEAVEIEVVSSVDVVYTDIDDKIKKLSIKL